MARRYVYLVEDDTSLRALVAKVLRGLPRVEVREYDGAEEALHDFATHLPVLIVADLGLQGMSGVEFIARSRQWFSKIPVLVITGCRSQFESQLRDLPGVEIWEKPFQILDLRQRVNDLLTTQVAERTKAFIPFGVLDYLQLASLGGQDLVLKVSLGDGRSATMEIVGGDIWDCHLGVLKGIEALGEALEHEAAGIDLAPLTRPPGERRIKDSTAQVLLELAVAQDTARAARQEELVR
jgi:CheY-like chemotaxis protein